MGEVADDMIEGLCCSCCGIYFIKEHGHPVLCTDCYTSEEDEEKSGIPEAYHPELGHEFDETNH